jgi:hypothetical protein
MSYTRRDELSGDSPASSCRAQGIAGSRRRTPMKTGVKMLAVMLFTLSLPVSVLAGSSDHGNPGVVPPQSHVQGLTYAQWSVRWWQWLLAIPAGQNPTFDTTGEDCAVGQSG